jgi:hypothetical protein
MLKVTITDKEGEWELPKDFTSLDRALAGAAKEMLHNRGAYEFPIKVEVKDEAGKVLISGQWQKPEILGRGE